jgi:hypothetical protein
MGFKRLPYSALILLSFALICCSCGRKASTLADKSSAEAKQLRNRYLKLRGQEEALKIEYDLAKNSVPYLVVDLPNRDLELKTRGRHLRRARILDATTSGIGNAWTALWTLEGRKPLAELERPKITPGAGEDATVEAAQKGIWGPARMPADYDLLCQDGMVLQIRSLPAQDSSNRVYRGLVSTYRHFVDWLREWNIGSSHKPHRVRVWVEENDARLIFWSLPKQMQILIVRDPVHP